MAKIIEVPAESEVSFEFGGVKRTLTFKGYLVEAMNNYEPSGKGYENILRGLAIVSKIQAMNGTLMVEDEEYKALAAAVETCGWTPPAARACIPFMKSVRSAQDVALPGRKE